MELRSWFQAVRESEGSSKDYVKPNPAPAPQQMPESQPSLSTARAPPEILLPAQPSKHHLLTGPGHGFLKASCQVIQDLQEGQLQTDCKIPAAPVC